MHTTQDSLYSEHKLLHRERLGNIVVCTNLEALKDIILHLASRKEDDRYLSVSLTYVGSQLETVFLRHHHIKHTYIIRCLQECAVTSLAVRAQVCLVTFCL